MSNLQKIEDLARAPNNKIRAIKLYRDTTGETLAVSKKAVEYFIEHGSWAATEATPSLNLNEIEKLISEKKIVQAIKLFRNSTNESLKTSKLTVEYFAEHGQWPPVPIEQSSSSTSSEPPPPLLSTADGRKAVGMMLLVFSGICGIFYFIVS